METVNPDRELAVMHQKAYVFLEHLVDPKLAGERVAMLLALRPRDEDYAKVFSPTAAAQAATAYSSLWTQVPAWTARPDQTVLEVHVARAEELAGGPRAQLFPGGYARIAHLLLPGRFWICWKLLTPGASAGLSFNGLVWLDDHFAWFPKPYRLLQTQPAIAVH